nr:hypothetical protein BaRGS_006098 [Batillaria attramentaria]
MIPCMFAWAAGFTIATLPLFLFTSGWGFYSQTSICLPLPITQRQFPGQQYAFGIFIVLNFAVFLLIGAGQLLIYRAAKSSSLQLTTNTKRREKDMIMARRLFLVVFTDFCCWFPVGVMGLLAALGVHLPDQVNVFVAVFALPINSAINPFLYTLNALLEKRNKRKRAMRIKMMLGNLHADLYSWPLARVQELAGHCERVTRRLQLHGEGINIPGPDRPTSSLNMRALAASNRGRQAETSSTFEESTTFSEV